MVRLKELKLFYKSKSKFSDDLKCSVLGILFSSVLLCRAAFQKHGDGLQEWKFDMQ